MKRKLARVQEAIRELRTGPFSNPMALEMKLDSLASEIIRLGVLSGEELEDSPNSLYGVLECLVRKELVKEEILATCENIESIMQQVDYEDLGESESENLEAEVEELCSQISDLLNKIEA